MRSLMGLVLVMMLSACGEVDFKFQCIDGHVYYKQKATDDFWTRTGKECR